MWLLCLITHDRRKINLLPYVIPIIKWSASTGCFFEASRNLYEFSESLVELWWASRWLVCGGSVVLAEYLCYPWFLSWVLGQCFGLFTLSFVACLLTSWKLHPLLSSPFTTMKVTTSAKKNKLSIVAGNAAWWL